MNFISSFKNIFKNNVQNCYEESFKLKIFFHLRFMQILEINFILSK